MTRLKIELFRIQKGTRVALSEEGGDPRRDRTYRVVAVDVLDNSTMTAVELIQALRRAEVALAKRKSGGES